MKLYAVFWVASCTLVYFADGKLTPSNVMAGAVLAAWPWLIVTIVRWLIRKVPITSKTNTSLLDHVLFRWTKEDAYTARDLLMSVCVFGATGAGKSSGSGLTLARAVVRLPKSGGLILASKPQDKQFWMDRFREQGRSDDLIIFDDSGKYKFNFLDFERECGADTRAITQYLMTTAEALEGKGTDRDPFWKISQGRFIHSAVEVIRLAEGEVTIPKIAKFIGTASTGGFKDDEQRTKFLEGYHNQLLEIVQEKADRKELSDRDLSDWNQAMAFWAREYPSMDSKVRTSVLAGVNNLLFTYNTGLVKDLVSTSTNVSPKDMENGVWVLLNLPLNDFGESGKIIMYGWKYSVQKYILRRQNPQSVICIWGDEYHQFHNSADAPFLATCRSYLGCMIVLSQSLFSFYKEGRENDAKEFLTNFNLKIAHTIGDCDTAKYLCSLVGQYREAFDTFDTESKGSMSEKYEDKLKVHELMTGLRSGQGGVVDGVLIKAGMPYGNGENFLKVEFLQT